jgi:hypothetical protein
MLKVSVARRYYYDTVPVSEIFKVAEPTALHAPAIEKFRKAIRAGEKIPSLVVIEISDVGRQRLLEGGKYTPTSKQKYWLENGHHRLAAYEAEGYTEVPVVVYPW